MLATLRLRQGWEELNDATRVPSADKDAVLDANDDTHEKLLHMKNEVENIKESLENLASRIDMSDTSQIVRLESNMDEMKKAVTEIGQKVGRIESDVANMKSQLVEFSNMKAALASLQEQLQMLLNGGIMPDTFPMYPFDQPPPGV